MKTRFIDVFIIPLIMIGVIEAYYFCSTKFKLFLISILTLMFLATTLIKFPWYLNLDINLKYLFDTLIS